MGFLINTSLIRTALRCVSDQNQPRIMKYLNVAEKNDAAKTIASLLSRGNSNRREGISNYNKIYEFDATVFAHPARMVMTSVSGHLLNFAFVATFKNWQSCNPVALFDAPLIKECPQDYQNIKKTLEREIRSCQGLIIWTDCDREGENIGFEVIKVCTDIKPNIPVYRAKFSEITTASVFRALNNLGQPNKNVSDAVDVRQELDLRTGAAFTRLQTLRFQKVFPQILADKLISYGSCQFPTLGFVVERYQAIEDFVSEQFWKIKMNHRIKDLTVDFNWKRERLFNKNACEAILDICKENEMATVELVESKPKSKWRPLPLDTVEMEKTVSRKLRINAKDTMKIAERLYTQGLISYPRTETNIFPKELNLVPLVEQQCADNRWGEFAQGVLNGGGPNPRQGRKSDQAHPPIHPTKYTNSLAGNEQKIYEFIVRHFLACVSKDALGHETVVHVDIAGEKFIAKGLHILEKNYLEVYVYDKWNAKEIHEYRNGDTFMPSELCLVEGNTTPPKLLTEADLISLMEKHGIGTDATHAEHIETIKSREYVGMHENLYFVPGTLGMGLVEGYNNVGLEISLAKPNLRADFENDLKLISEGLKNPETVRREQIEKYRAVFIMVVEKMRAIDRSLAHRLQDQPQEIPDEEIMNPDEFKPVLKCPKCGKDMVVRNRKNSAGKFLSCVGYPACKNAVWFPICIDTIDVLDENCTNCGPNFKKLMIKFKQNPFPGEPNPNKLCIGGCDNVVLDTLNINSNQIRKPTTQNVPAIMRETAPNRNTNIPVIPNQHTLNNWITGADDNIRNSQTSQNSNMNNRTQQNNRGTAQNNINRTLNGTNNSNRSYGTNAGGSADNRNTNSRNLPRSFLDSSTNVLLPVPNGNLNSNRNHNFNGNTNHPNHNGDEHIVCHCKNDAILLTVRKEGPNTGRQFYKCQAGLNGAGCDFFMWAEENAPRPPPAPTNSSSLSSLKCDCNLPAIKRRVTKAGPNNGKEFFCCSKPIGEGCKFFKWADEVNNGNPQNGDDDDGDDDDGGGGGGGGPSQSWNGGHTSRWTGGSGNSWKKKNNKFKRKNKGKTKTMPYNAAEKKKNTRKCGICKEVGHIKTNCPNSK